MTSSAEERPRTPWRPLVVVLAAAVLVVAGLWVAQYRVSAGAWPWDGQPTRVSWCDRDYQREGPPMTRADVLAAAGAVEPVRTVAPLAGSEQLYAPIAQPLQLPGEPCAMQVYLRTGPDSYLEYGILGGP